MSSLTLCSSSSLSPVTHQDLCLFKSLSDLSPSDQQFLKETSYEAWAASALDSEWKIKLKQVRVLPAWGVAVRLVIEVGNKRTEIEIKKMCAKVCYVLMINGLSWKCTLPAWVASFYPKVTHKCVFYNLRLNEKQILYLFKNINLCKILRLNHCSIKISNKTATFYNSYRLTDITISNILSHTGECLPTNSEEVDFLITQIGSLPAPLKTLKLLNPLTSSHLQGLRCTPTLQKSIIIYNCSESGHLKYLCPS
ncbi:unnamed protein product [Moneuplotes crassus]|uniref:Uncharacterized protein n=1 Tax=Euplotes crassus TaxID=5936 RepID=A0AAD2D2J9_EUPCR|nr:unnamed protein product [Moneuplotes crassus]